MQEVARGERSMGKMLRDYDVYLVRVDSER
jgi:hypothetical protein